MYVHSTDMITRAGWQRSRRRLPPRRERGVEIRDNETALQFLETRFVKLTAGGAFDGLQNHLANRRTDLRIVGAVLAAPGLTGPTSGMSVSLL